MMKFGWHYTSLDNWRSIQWQGLCPVPLLDNRYLSLRDMGCTHGVMVFKRFQTDVAHTGQVIERAGALGAFNVVLLRVDYHEQDSFLYIHKTLNPNDALKLCHDGTFGKTEFHDQEPMDILVRTIPPDRLRLVWEFDLVRLLAPESAAPSAAWRVAA